MTTSLSNDSGMGTNIILHLRDEQSMKHPLENQKVQIIDMDDSLLCTWSQSRFSITVYTLSKYTCRTLSIGVEVDSVGGGGEYHNGPHSLANKQFASLPSISFQLLVADPFTWENEDSDSKDRCINNNHT